MEESTVIGILSMLVTILLFLFGWLRASIAANNEQIDKVQDELDDHKLHIKDQYHNKDEVTVMIGLISSPIQAAVSELKQDLGDYKAENKIDMKDLSTKLDQLLQRNYERRNINPPANDQ